MNFIFKQFKESVWLKRNYWLIVILFISGSVHMLNSFQFPSYREDEGTYTSQAWSIVNQGRLAPYTYWYDHAPLGWALLAAWSFLFGGDFFSVGLSANLGRVMMMVLQVAATFLIYKIVENITGKKLPAAIAALMFSLTPLAITLHRRILLDNIMLFWFLLALFLLTKPMRIKYVILSAIAFCIAALTKESAAPLIFTMVAIMLLQTHKNNKHFSVAVWLAVALLLISFYPLFALLKGELFPTNTFLGGNQPHVSLFDALGFHINREAGSTFTYALRNTWLPFSPFFLPIGALVTVVHLIWFRQKWSFLIATLSLSYFLFIVRGQVLDWYIIPLIAFFSISIALMFNQIGEYFAKKSGRMMALTARFGVLSIIVLVVVLEFSQRMYIFSLDQTRNQVEVVSWVKNNLDPAKIVLIDNYAFVDFNSRLKDIERTKYHYYWKADTDPQIRYNVLKNDWNNIDYLLFTPAVAVNLYADSLPIVRNAYENSHVIKRFDEFDVLDEGYPVEIREVNNSNGVIQTSWGEYKKKFITPEGRVVDPKQNNITTSEGQSYAMLRAVWIWQGDKEYFDRAYIWTKYNMYLPEQGEFAWLYGQDADGDLRILDRASATDADQDMALALLFAYRRWGDSMYLEDAKKIISSIWSKQVVEIDGLKYLVSSARSDRGYLINPSYFSPASYRIFDQVDLDQSHDWEKLADDTYIVLSRLTRSNAFKNNYGLVPDWFLLAEDGQYHSAAEVKPYADSYGYDGFRLMWRLALDAEWFNSESAKTYLSRVSKFYLNEWTKKGQIASRYSVDGKPVSNFDDISTYAGALAALKISRPEESIDIYSNQFWAKYHNGFWGDSRNYYVQNWAWFASAFYAENLPNLWSKDYDLALGVIKK